VYFTNKLWRNVAAFAFSSVAICSFAQESHIEQSPAVMTTPAAAANAPGETGASLDEIIVTAQHRVERLQNVPISAIVIGEQALVEGNLNSFTDISNTTPSVHIGEAGRSNNMYIRGIGSGENPSFDQSVGLFIDDIYHGRSRITSSTLLDLDHLEILKGPQSTFFGNNAIAGALNVVTKKPGGAFDASIRALYGEHGQYAAEGAVGGPITDALSMRVAAIADGSNGWINDTYTHSLVPEDHNLAARWTTSYDFTQDLNVTMKVEGSQHRNNGALGLQLVNCPPAAPFVAGAFCKAAIAAGVPTGLGNNENAASGGQKLDVDSTETVAVVNYQHWGHTFTSVTGYYNYTIDFDLDADGIPPTLINGVAPEQYHQFSQEFRVASPSGGSIEYLAGVYFQPDHLATERHVNYGFLSPVIASIPTFAPLVPYLPLSQNVYFAQSEHTGSVFGSLGWNVTDYLKVTGGLRASDVTKTYHLNSFFGSAEQNYGGFVPFPASLAPLGAAFANKVGLGATSTLSGNRDDHALMPSAKIQYQLDHEAMMYFSFARGFKSGGFNAVDATGVAANVPFQPEHVNAYELGLKSEWLDHRVLANVDVFRSDYDNLQVAVNTNAVTGNFVSVVRNAAASRSEGVEFETQWAISRSLRLSAAATYLESYYINYPGAGSTNQQLLAGAQTQNLSGRPTEFAPKWSGVASATYTIPLMNGLQLTTEAREFLSSPYFLSSTDDSLLRQGSYARLDGRLTLESASGRWAIDIIGKNLTDRIIETFGTNEANALGSVLLQKEEPRNVAAQFRYHW